MSIELITPKNYVAEFNIDIKTARVWYNDDLKMLGRKRLTRQHFDFIYLDSTPIALQFKPKETVKKGQIKDLKNQKR